jgi:hypothetical protein
VHAREGRPELDERTHGLLGSEDMHRRAEEGDSSPLQLVLVGRTHLLRAEAHATTEPPRARPLEGRIGVTGARRGHGPARSRRSGEPLELFFDQLDSLDEPLDALWKACELRLLAHPLAVGPGRHP